MKNTLGPLLLLFITTAAFAQMPSPADDPSLRPSRRMSARNNSDELGKLPKDRGSWINSGAIPMQLVDGLGVSATGNIPRFAATVDSNLSTKALNPGDAIVMKTVGTSLLHGETVPEGAIVRGTVARVSNLASGSSLLEISMTSVEWRDHKVDVSGSLTRELIARYCWPGQGPGCDHYSYSKPNLKDVEFRPGKAAVAITSSKREIELHKGAFVEITDLSMNAK